MKIYDCFTFFNELDLLEIRLEILSPYVDKFVLVEGNKTFSGELKESIFLKNKERFKKWESKIIYKFVELPKLNRLDKFIVSLANSKYLPKFGTNSFGLNYLMSFFGIGRWKIIFAQRDKIFSLIKNLKNEDIILFSDLDEIPDIKSKKELINLVKKNKILCFKHKSFLYHLNGFVEDGWIGTRAFNFETLLNKFNKRFSFIRNERIQKVFDKKQRNLYFEGGWHFTYLGDLDTIFLKTKSTAERTTEINKEKLIENYNQGVLVDKFGNETIIKYALPEYIFSKKILKTLKKYPYLIKKL